MANYGNLGSFLTPAAKEFAGFDLPITQRFQYSAEQAITEGLAGQFIDWMRIQRTRYYPSEVTPTHSTVNELRERYRNTPLANQDWTHFTNSEGYVNTETERYMYNRAMEREAMAEINKNNYSSLSRGAISFAGSMAGSMVDPPNLLLALIPAATAPRFVAGTLLSKTAPRIGQGILAHAAVGAAENALITGAIYEPLSATLHGRMGDPYTAQDYWTNIGIGSLIGAGFGAVGGLFDIRGTRLVRETAMEKALSDFEKNHPSKYKQDTFSDFEKRLSNADADTVDLVVKAKIQSEALGRTAFSADKLFELTQDMNRSTITPAARELGRLSIEIREGGTANQTRVRLGEARKRGKGENRQWYAKYEVEGKIIEGSGSTKKQAELDLNNKVYNAIKKYEPTITKRGDMYVARYTEDQGKAGMLTGAGRTEVEAVNNLNARYRDITRSISEVDQTMRDIELLREDIRSGKVTGYATDWQNAMAEKGRQLREDYENGLLREREYKKGLKDLEKEIKEFETDYAIAEENLNNYLKSAYDRPIPESAEQLFQQGEEAFNAEPEGVKQQRKDMDAEVAKAKEATKTPSDQALYNQNQENTVFASEGFLNLPEEIKTRITNEYATAKADAEILKSERIKDIVDGYTMCRRGA